jgi:hypothetical protein
MSALFKDSKVQLSADDKTALGLHGEARPQQIKGLYLDYMRDTLAKSLTINEFRDEVLTQLKGQLSGMTPMMLLAVLEKIGAISNDNLELVTEVFKKSADKTTGGTSIFIQGDVNNQTQNNEFNMSPEHMKLIRSVGEIYHALEAAGVDGMKPVNPEDETSKG